jgi:hypothetical protein
MTFNPSSRWQDDGMALFVILHLYGIASECLERKLICHHAENDKVILAFRRDSTQTCQGVWSDYHVVHPIRLWRPIGKHYAAMTWKRLVLDLIGSVTTAFGARKEDTTLLDLLVSELRRCLGVSQSRRVEKSQDALYTFDRNRRKAVHPLYINRPSFGFWAIYRQNFSIQELWCGTNIGMLLVVSPGIDETNPFLREWSLLAINALCENSCANQVIVIIEFTSSSLTMCASIISGFNSLW